MSPKVLTEIITIICFIAASGCVYKHSQWPEIKEINGSYKFDYKNNNEYKLTINSKSDKPLYYFVAKFFTEDEDDASFNYSGVIHCRLYNDNVDDLFCNQLHATRDWQSDARFLNEELSGLIGAKSSRSLIQRIKVRGMYIEIEINNVKANHKGIIIGGDFKILFLNDSTACSELSVDDNAVRDRP